MIIKLTSQLIIIFLLLSAVYKNCKQQIYEMIKFPTLQQTQNQFLIRFPDDIANQLNQFFDGKSQAPNIKITPFIQSLGLGEQKISFKVNVNGTEKKGSLVQLATISQTFKTIDRVNFFKSNDITEMILVQDDKAEVPEAVAKRVRESNGNIRYKSHSGISPATKFIKQRFYKKKPVIPVEEVKKIESELHSLRQQLPFLTKGPDIELSESKKKRKMHRKMNQTI